MEGLSASRLEKTFLQANSLPALIHKHAMEGIGPERASIDLQIDLLLPCSTIRVC